MKIYLITGVTGFVGYNLAKRLLNENYIIIGLGRSEDNTDLSNYDNYNYIKLDLATGDLNILDRFLINGVFNLASQQPNKKDIDYNTYYKSNVKTTLNLIKYFGSKKLEFFVYTSTISIFGQPQEQLINETTVPQPENFYSLTKYISEAILKFESDKLNMKIIILRLQSVFGKGDGYGIVHTFYEELKNNKDVELFSMGKIHRNLVLIDDVIDTFFQILQKHKILDKFNVFNVASNNSLTTLEIANIVKKFLKSDSKIICSNKKYIFDWDVFVDNTKIQKKLTLKLNSLNDAILKYLTQK